MLKVSDEQSQDVDGVQIQAPALSSLVPMPLGEECPQDFHGPLWGHFLKPGRKPGTGWPFGQLRFCLCPALALLEGGWGGAGVSGEARAAW